MLPIQSRAISRVNGPGTSCEAGVRPSDCPWYKKAACVVAAVGCGAVCVGTWGTACLECIGAAVGGCGDCL